MAADKAAEEKENGGPLASTAISSRCSRLLCCKQTDTDTKAKGPMTRSSNKVAPASLQARAKQDFKAAVATIEVSNLAGAAVVAECASGSDWSKKVDDTSGHFFFFNEKTGATAWEEPAEYSDPTQHKQLAECAHGSDWTKQLDEAGGKEYYFNQATGATQWEQPEEYGDPTLPTYPAYPSLIPAILTPANALVSNDRHASW